MSFKSTRNSPLLVSWSGTAFLNHGLDSFCWWQSILAWSARIIVLLIKKGVLPETMAIFKWNPPTGTTNAWELVSAPWFPNLKVISHGHRYNLRRVLGRSPRLTQTHVRCLSASGWLPDPALQVGCVLQTTRMQACHVGLTGMWFLCWSWQRFLASGYGTPIPFLFSHLWAGCVATHSWWFLPINVHGHYHYRS